MRNGMLRGFSAGACVAALGFAVAAGAAGDDVAVIKYRQKIMQAQGAAMGAIGDILKNKLPHEKDIASHARVLAITAKLIPGAFEKPVKTGKTDAKPEIWEKWDHYERDATRLAEAADKLAKVAEGSDAAAVGAQVKEVGGACQHCHEDFRKPEEQSYKSR
jgi:cytochrome c556